MSHPRRPPRTVVWLVSTVWSSLSAGARLAASRGWLRSEKLPCRVVSVGNLQAGGAGKTPLVACIAREAHERGLTAWILCRGYGGEWENSGGGVILPGRPAPGAALCGDEAALLHDLAPQAAIGVGSDRIWQFERLREAIGRLPDLVVLDDGFQHWKIHKDVEIVALTSHGPSEVPYRDRWASLSRADLVVWTKGEKRPAAAGGPAFARVRYRLPAPGPGAAAHWLVSGVADAASVERLARESGYRIDRHVSFPDHARYGGAQVEGLIAEAAKAGARVAVTGKDWVKWRELGGVAALPGTRITVLEPELDWQEGREQWNRVLWGS